MTIKHIFHHNYRNAKNLKKQPEKYKKYTSINLHLIDKKKLKN